jgi:hypothetical protein
MDGALRGGRVWWRSGTSSVSPGERSRERRSEEVEGHAVRYAAGRCRRVGEYSTEVQQLTRTRAHSWGRGRTVTCGDGRGWTCCRQMACKRSGVRISLAPPGQKHNSNDSNSKYSSKVQQRRPDGPPYVCSDRFPPLARAGGKTAESSHCSAAFRRTTWANSSSPGALTLTAWVVTRLVRAASRTMTVVVFAGGVRTAGPLHPRSTPSTRNGRLRTRVRGSRPWARLLRRMAPTSLCVAPLRRWAAPWRSLAQLPGALWRLPESGVPRPDHAAAASSPNPGITSSWSRRAPA